jgi:hypothetical protein
VQVKLSGRYIITAKKTGVDSCWVISLQLQELVLQLSSYRNSSFCKYAPLPVVDGKALAPQKEESCVVGRLPTAIKMKKKNTN